jgi:3-hydroxyacyl-CoA dehydrogenase
VKAGKKTQEEAKKSFDTVMGRIKTSTNIADAEDCDLIIEVLPLFSVTLASGDINNN